MKLSFGLRREAEQDQAFDLMNGSAEEDFFFDEIISVKVFQAHEGGRLKGLYRGVHFLTSLIRRGGGSWRLWKLDTISAEENINERAIKTTPPKTKKMDNERRRAIARNREGGVGEGGE